MNEIAERPLDQTIAPMRRLLIKGAHIVGNQDHARSVEAKLILFVPAHDVIEEVPADDDDIDMLLKLGEPFVGTAKVIKRAIALTRSEDSGIPDFYLLKDVRCYAADPFDELTDETVEFGTPVARVLFNDDELPAQDIGDLSNDNLLFNALLGISVMAQRHYVSGFYRAADFGSEATFVECDMLEYEGDVGLLSDEAGPSGDPDMCCMRVYFSPKFAVDAGHGASLIAEPFTQEALDDLRKASGNTDLAFDTVYRIDDGGSVISQSPDGDMNVSGFAPLTMLGFADKPPVVAKRWVPTVMRRVGYGPTVRHRQLPEGALG